MRAEINNAEKVHVTGKKEDRAEEEAPHLPPSARCLGLGDQQISGVCWLFLINFPFGDKRLLLIISELQIQNT